MKAKLIVGMMVVSLMMTGCTGNEKTSYDQTTATTVTESTTAETTTKEETTESTTVEMTAKEEITEKTTKEETTKTTNDVDISNNPDEFMVALDGNTYQLPFKVEDLIANGWEIKDAETEIKPDAYLSTMVAKKGDRSIYIDIANLDVDTKRADECHVIVFNLDPMIGERENWSDFMVAGNIALGSKYEDVQSVYGESTDIYEGEMYTKYGYGETYEGYEFYVENGLVTHIVVRSATLKDETITTSVDVDSSYAVNYTSPTSVSDNLFDFQADYDGLLVGVPAPVGYFLENGWTFVNATPEDVIKSGQFTTGLEMMKNGLTTRVNIKNYSDNAESVVNCHIVNLVSTKIGGSVNVPMTLAKGIGIGSTLEELTAAYSDLTPKIEESSLHSYYEYGDFDERVTFVLNEGVVEKIEIAYQPKKLNE